MRRIVHNQRNRCRFGRHPLEKGQYLKKTGWKPIGQCHLKRRRPQRLGATQALEYLPVPGRFEGDVPMQPGQKAWAISR
jgi:hypothetical protein